MISCCMFLFGGCGKTPKETITNRNIPLDDVSEFYYTYENINFNAFFQRYRFYIEDGKYMFHHETRERPGDYGPTTEEDITNSGTFELTAEQWKDFLTFLKDGTVSERSDSGESGSRGPWTFIYWKDDKGRYQVFEFPSYDTRVHFEEFCSALAKAEPYSVASDESSEVYMNKIKINEISYSPGYGDMLGGYHEVILSKDENGGRTCVCRDREDHSSPTVTAVYRVVDEAVERLEAFIAEKDILSLQDRPDSDMFMTDYSPWSWGIDYETAAPGKTERGYCRLEQYKEYSGQDYELLNELSEMFNALRGEKIS